MTSLSHEGLDATFVGVDLGPCIQYRGIQYGTVNRRFGEPSLLHNWSGKTIDCQRATECHIFYDQDEDEYKCLNLDVSRPKVAKTSDQLPVLLWVHGGSQIISYGHGASKIGDTAKLVADSLQTLRPVIVVSVQYRLNIFHVGDGSGTRNLGFKDLQVAVDWVRRHIAGFGGDPNRITIAGESAGAALVHGLVVSGAQVEQAIMMSGSFYMSAPRPETMAKASIIEPVLSKVRAMGFASLAEASIDALLKAQEEIPIRSVFMQQDTCFDDWPAKTGAVSRMLIGDCEYESVLWRNGVETMTAAQIDACFDGAGTSAAELKGLYHISKTRDTQSKHGALDFLNDVAWAMPVELLSDLYQRSDKGVYRYVFDQANPWQTSSRAHHAVDLIYLFGGFDLSMNPRAQQLGQEMRRRFIDFVYGAAPWSESKAFAFGPYGECKEVSAEEVGLRRRSRQIEQMRKMDSNNVMAVLGMLAAGRISLHN